MGNSAAVAIPEKLFFKIGEVCEIVGVQAHVLRYWESEFSVLAPQKNRAGQRTYRKRDVETALRIRELLYDDLFTIAGAKKKIASEMRGGSKLKVVNPDSPRPIPVPVGQPRQPQVSEGGAPIQPALKQANDILNPEDRGAIRALASQLNELLTLLDSPDDGL